MSAPPQIFVRNRQLQVWGPLEPATVGLMVEAGVIRGELEVSLDGVTYADPARFPPRVREFFPPELGGTAPGAQLPQGAQPVAPVVPAPARPAMRPPNPPGVTPPPVAPGVMAGPGASAAPMAGPGTTPAPIAGPGAAAAAMAGPGARAAAEARRPSPPPGAPVAAGARPGNVNPPKASAPVIAPPAMTPPVMRPPLGTPPAPTPSVVAPAAAAPPGAPAGPGAVAARPAPVAPSPSPAPTPARPPAPTTVVPPSGELAKVSALHLYYLAAVGEHTGLLRVNQSDRTIEVHFRKGNPEYVGSTHPEDSVGGFLLANNLVRPDQLAQADAARERFGGELVSALFGLGILNAASAFAQLAQRAAGLLMKVLFAESGAFTYEPKELPPHRALPLGSRWAPLLEFMRRLPLPDLRRRMQPMMDRPLMKSGGRLALSDLRLSAQETRALGHIDGVRSLTQLTQELPQDAETLVRVALLLKELELVSFAAAPVRPAPQPAPVTGAAASAPPRPAPAASPSAAPPSAAASAPAAGSAPRASVAGPLPTVAASPRPPAAAAPARPVAAAPATVPVDHDAELKLLRAKAATIKDENHFELLGVPQTADASAVKVAYFKLAKAYHPDTITSDAPPELAKLKQDIFARVGEAYRTLSDDKSRAAYLEELKSGGGEVDVAQILAAEETFQKGMILVKARKFPEAVKLLDEAIEGNGDEGEFFAWRGFAKFFVHADKKQGRLEAEKDLNLALKKHARCAQAYYFLGQVAKLSGDNTTALAQFKKAIELQPDHIDAQREVRMFSGKK